MQSICLHLHQGYNQKVSEFIAAITTVDNEDTFKSLGLDLPDREAMVDK